MSAGNDEAQVAFAYSAVRTADGSKRARVQRDSMTLPLTLGTSDGDVVDYGFGSGGDIDDTFGRVNKVSVDSTSVAEYQYQGAGMLVTTHLHTQTANTSYRLHSGTSGGGFSGYLDNFGRVTRSQWKKLLGSPVTLYDVTLTYDRDGNITSADDAATAGNGDGWDAKYAMDNLNRLLDADEGTLSTGSITSRTRRERWDENSAGYGLDQVGNWKRRKLDLDGDGSYSGGGELDDTGAFNAANEWLTRDTDSNSSVNYTLAHDAVGNMTDDGKDYTYVYDVFGRLVKVKARSGGATVAEYAYDALGQRISTHTDVGGNGSVTTADHTYWFIYDDRWRIIATYRCEWDGGASAYLPDTEHKEQFVWHNAGMDGRGGSSYIDSVILRDRDNSSGWLAASDGDHEERRLFGPNWRADVSLVMNTNGRPLERIKYTAYGTPITLTDIDYNDDKSIDSDDLGDFVNTPYDWDLDGDTNSPADSDNDAFSDDYFAVAGNSYGRGTLSLAAIGNRIGYAGYVYDRFISGSDGGKWHVRHRVLDSGLGRWTRRDRLGWIDGPSLYAYVRCNPVANADTDGCFTRLRGAFSEAKCGGFTQQWTFWWPPALIGGGGGAPCNGWIVQLIDETVTYLPCDSSPPRSTRTQYWEVWTVTKGRTTPNQRMRPPLQVVGGGVSSDVWNRGPRVGIRATREIVGTAKYYCTDAPGLENFRPIDWLDLPLAPREPHDRPRELVPSSPRPWDVYPTDRPPAPFPQRVPASGGLPSTTWRPSFWDTAPAQAGDQVRAISVWKCCNRPYMVGNTVIIQ
ncbi:MAG: RHS repeat-associated core domain-containing protein [Phycisphaerales bacterium]